MYCAYMYIFTHQLPSYNKWEVDCISTLYTLSLYFRVNSYVMKEQYCLSFDFLNNRV